jgi:hypothetical protein
LATDAGFSRDAGAQGEVIAGSGSNPGTREEAIISLRFPVRIEGLKALPAEVILDMLRLPPRATPTEQTAADVQKQVLDYLIRTGFELAKVEARVDKAGILVEVDEGQIERIVFVGQLSYQLVRFKLSLKLPNNVFSRPVLERQIKDLSEALSVPDVRWELVRSSEVSHKGPQASQRGGAVSDAAQGDLFLAARRAYEVRVYFPSNTLGTSLGFDLRSGFTNGIETGLNYPGRPIFGEKDGWLAEASVGMGLRSTIETGKPYAHLSRVLLGLRYHTGPIVPGLSAHGILESEWVARQRADVNLENYNGLTTIAGVHLELEIRKGLTFWAGGGFEWRRLFDFEVATGLVLPPEIGFQDRKRPFLRVMHEFVFNPGVQRWGRRHSLMGEVRQYFTYRQEQGSGWVDLRYQHVQEFGWNDLWITGRGHLSWGHVNFHDDISVGEYLRSLFGTQFVPSALNLQLEYRFSIARDLLKVSLFNDVIFIADPARVSATIAPQFATGFGPGVHLLVEDLFQVDSYLAFGFRRRAELDIAFSVQIVKAF